MRYARRMNGYSEVPHNGEINNYLRKDLDAKATAKNTACWNLLGKVRTKRTLCFSLYTALELCGVELPRHSTLPQKDFYVTVRSKGTRSSLDNVDYRIWNAKFNSIAFSNGVTCMHPMDAWIQFAQYLNLTELVVLAEALIRRYGYAIEQFTQRLTAFHRDANTASWPSSTFMPGINRRQPYHQCAQRGIQEAETSKTQQSITTLIKYGVAITSHGAAIPP